jgi:hypothetical protein
MFALCLRKWFYDLWDNYVVMLAASFLYVMLLVPPVLALQSVASIGFGPALLLFITAGVVHTIAAGLIARLGGHFAQGGSFSLRELPSMLKDSWRASAFLGAINYALIGFSFAAVPYYLSQQGMLPLVALGFLFWALIAWVLISQWAMPLNAQIEPKIKKMMRKSLMLFFDNTLFSFGMALVGAVATGVPFFFVYASTGDVFFLGLGFLFLTIFPGAAGGLSWGQTALYLRMRKYDWLEAHPDANRKRLPWAEIMAEDEESVGRRGFRGLFMPWKNL